MLKILPQYCKKNANNVNFLLMEYWQNPRRIKQVASRDI